MADQQDGDRRPLPPRRRDPAPARPHLPEERPTLPRGVWAELRSTAREGEAEDLARALGAAGAALDDDDPEQAVAVLTWAKSRAPRSGALREALGVAHYHAGDFRAARRELQAYVRLSGRADQHHLLADCARALGDHDKVEELVTEMDGAGDVPADRLAEAKIVLAGSRADRGDLRGALTVLERAAEGGGGPHPWHARIWYAAADLAERAGDRQAAADYLEAVLTVDEDFLDAADRLSALTSPPGPPDAG